jgi:hypothetical protein
MRVAPVAMARHGDTSRERPSPLIAGCSHLTDVVTRASLRELLRETHGGNDEEREAGRHLQRLPQTRKRISTKQT